LAGATVCDNARDFGAPFHTYQGALTMSHPRPVSLLRYSILVDVGQGY
jgi:hypothetical protein